jgi:hypothetical protein
MSRITKKGGNMKAVKPKVTVTSRKLKSRKPEAIKPHTLSYDELRKKCRQLASWLKPLIRWSQRAVFVSETERGYKVRLYTSNQIYHVTAVPNRYLGCVAISRRARPGEDWFRGNDLRDGKWSKVTWQKILADIVSYELEPLRNPDWGSVKEMQATCHAKH